MQTSRKFTRTLLALLALVMMAVSAVAEDGDEYDSYPKVATVSDQKAGSVLFYNYYTSSATGQAGVNTRVNMTNTNDKSSIFVHLFFISSACQPTDSYICLTQNQTVSFLMSDIDPGTTGYIVAIASDEYGCPADFNFLIGDEYIKLASGHTANLGAEAIARVLKGDICSENSPTALLKFDGDQYDKVASVLAVDNFGSRADGNDTIVVINSIGGDYSQNNTGPTVGSLFVLVYDDTESVKSATLSSNACQFAFSLSRSGIRTAPPIENFVPAGRTGWLKFGSSAGNRAYLGAVLNYNSNAGNAAGAFTGGHNLHKLAFDFNTSITIPVFPATCN